MRLIVLLTLSVLLLVPTVVCAAPPEGKHIRATDSRILAALAQGEQRSAAFRDLASRVERGDVIVYVEMQPLLRGRLAGSMSWVVATASFRYLRIGLNPELTGSNLVSVLAHELQHVAEIGDAPWVVNERTLAAHYRDVGFDDRTRADHWDTEAARAMGDLVRREIAGGTMGSADALLIARSVVGAGAGQE